MVLEPVSQHGSVDLVKQSVVNLDHIVRPDAKNVAVVCGMVDLAKRQSVGHDRITTRCVVGDDVRRIE